MIRKIIQILTVNDRLIALCEDGSMWQRDLMSEVIEYNDQDGTRKCVENKNNQRKKKI